ncbi:antitoxin Xre-like helix-turn-helix domain-containing protein [Methylobrevis pamukkalensis]|uniref:Uncharacterized protein n=1 Tax=Methylobrevis pamukkalensis TaxID=1439726 RepID=A0A1E3H4Y1_9HYPH|nr:antitoxin Xre-like helix-turn-helix domain-containing protein [Methylobrevis pamukkalensis]ODN71215.1 hypothetical protein A6302_01412 [Methylobrevis pamukkalensis]
MHALTTVADVLGIPARKQETASPFALMTRIEEGLSIDALDRVSALLAPGDSRFRFDIVPRATLARRKAGGVLSADEGTRVARLARVWSLALDVWETPEAARGFLFRPHAMLEDARPVDVVIRSEIGAELVLGILGRLKYGTAA